MESNRQSKTDVRKQHRAYFSVRTDIPHYYQAHMKKDDYEIKELRARVMPFTRFASEVFKI